MSDERDPYADVPPPDESDGPQEPVDDSELEEESHPTVPEDSHSEYRFEWSSWPPSSVDYITYPEGVDPGKILDDLIGAG
jgi:hypothetical protein